MAQSEEDPRNREARGAKDEAIRIAIKDEIAERQQILTEVAGTPAGLRVLKMLREICGFDVADRVIRSDGAVDTVASLLNTERRNVYLNLRSCMTREVRIAVENGIEETEEKK